MAKPARSSHVGTRSTLWGQLHATTRRRDVASVVSALGIEHDIERRIEDGLMSGAGRCAAGPLQHIPLPSRCRCRLVSSCTPLHQTFHLVACPLCPSASGHCLAWRAGGRGGGWERPLHPERAVCAAGAHPLALAAAAVSWLEGESHPHPPRTDALPSSTNTWRTLLACFRAGFRGAHSTDGLY
jgi:hypothetical protein